MPLSNGWLRTMVLAAAATTLWVGAAQAETRSFYSPLLKVDPQGGYIVIANSGAIIGIEVPPEAKPHLETLQVSNLIDVVVEMRGDQPPLLKRWKLASGESPCRIFDGKECKK